MHASSNLGDLTFQLPRVWPRLAPMLLGSMFSITWVVAGAVMLLLITLLVTSGSGLVAVAFMICMLAAWAVAGAFPYAFVATTLIYRFGRRIVSVNGQSICEEARLLGLPSREQWYNLRHVSDVREVFVRGVTRNNLNQHIWVDPEARAIAFDYKGESVVIGEGLNADELDQLARRLKIGATGKSNGSMSLGES